MSCDVMNTRIVSHPSLQIIARHGIFVAIRFNTCTPYQLPNKSHSSSNVSPYKLKPDLVMNSVIASTDRSSCATAKVY